VTTELFGVDAVGSAESFLTDLPANFPKLACGRLNSQKRRRTL
jgi:hypothetical protein